MRVVTMRAPDMDGTGDARRAANILAGLEALGVHAKVSVLMPTTAGLATMFKGLAALPLVLRIAACVLRHPTLPLQVAVGQTLLNRQGLGARSDEVRLYMTSRTVPWHTAGVFAVDFVDSLAENARQRAQHEVGWRRRFYRMEARRLATWETKVAAGAVCSFAVSAQEAELIGDRVQTIPIDLTTTGSAGPSLQDDGPMILFAGSLFYRPNAEAAEWIIRELLPELIRLGVSPRDLAIAGRRPSPALVRAARSAGVRLLADVDDLLAVIAGADVVLAPIALGAGVQTKVLNAALLERPLVITPRANRGLALPASDSLQVIDREPKAWARAIVDILRSGTKVDPRVAAQLARNHDTQFVRSQWIEALALLVDRQDPA